MHRMETDQDILQGQICVMMEHLMTIRRKMKEEEVVGADLESVMVGSY